MKTIRQTIESELGGNRYSYIELYDIDTDAPIYKGIAWDCPYDATYVVKEYQVYNANNKVCFTMWVDFTENNNDDVTNYENKLFKSDVDDDEIIIISYDETTEVFNTPLGEMTIEEFIKWKYSIDRH